MLHMNPTDSMFLCMYFQSQAGRYLWLLLGEGGIPARCSEERPASAPTGDKL